MVGVGVPDTQDVEARLPGLRIDVDEVLRVQGVAVAQTLRGQVASLGDAQDLAGSTDQQAADLVGVTAAGHRLELTAQPGVQAQRLHDPTTSSCFLFR